MIVVIFEVWPSDKGESEYLRLAQELLPQVEEVPGFISIERYRSVSEPQKLISLSTWTDEASIQAWRNSPAHRGVQIQGRAGIFTNYRLRVAEVTRDYSISDRDQVPDDSHRFHSSPYQGAKLKTELPTDEVHHQPS